MKLITLNAWGGKLYEPLIEFIKTHSNDIDIFCFQDVLFGKEPTFSPIERGRINLYEEIKDILNDFGSVISRELDHSFINGEILSQDVGSGKVVFFRKSMTLKESGDFDVSDNNLTETMVSSKCQWLNLLTSDGEITILNLHGLWQRGSKKQDTTERIEQSKRVSKFLSTIEGKKILAGDFNMVPDGESIRILENNMINLVKTYKVETTRSSHYPRGEKFADYILVSKDVEVKDFKVLQDEISDHLPLFVEFN